LHDALTLSPWPPAFPAPQHHRSHITSLAYSPDSRLLASASRDSSIALWDIYPPQAQKGS
jgi:WD40 repeat protein